MMCLRYICKGFVLCFTVLFLVMNAVADISLDYYLGNGDLRTSTILQNNECKTNALMDYCYKKCGPIHICMFGQCVCGKFYATPQNNPFKEIPIKRSWAYNTGAESFHSSEEDDDKQESRKGIVEYEIIPETPIILGDGDSRSDSSEEIEEEKDDEDSGKESNEEWNNSAKEELIDSQPILRHHIAHFCATLKKARACIRKCLKKGKPAFCGKDHHCYCGHHYGGPGRDPPINPAAIRNQYLDLYEKYFGPKTVKKHNSEEN